jgi:hypothetical protein
MTTPTHAANEQAAPAPDATTNKDLIRRWFHAMEQGSLEEVQAYWAQDVENGQQQIC